MLHLRFWLTLLIGWVCLIANLNRLASPGEIGLFAQLSAVAIVCLVLITGQPRGSIKLPVYLVALLLAPAGRLVGGEGFVGADFAFAVVETCIIVISLLLADQVLQCITSLRRVAEDAVTIQLGAELIETGRGEPGVQEEMARARRFERPLTVITVSAKGRRKQQELHAVLQKAQRDVIDRYVEGRLHRLLQTKVRDCDIVTRQNGQFLIVMPETDREFAQQVVARVRDAASDEIGLTVNAGIAAFPQEERTLVGLLDRASAEMDEKLLGQVPRTPK